MSNTTNTAPAVAAQPENVTIVVKDGGIMGGLVSIVTVTVLGAVAITAAALAVAVSPIALIGYGTHRLVRHARSRRNPYY